MRHLFKKVFEIIRPTPKKTYLMGESAFRSDKGGEQHGRSENHRTLL